MDDFKLYVNDDDDLEDLLSTLKYFGSDIGIQFGLKKCAKVTFKKGSLIKSNKITKFVYNSKTHRYNNIYNSKHIV